MRALLLAGVVASTFASSGGTAATVTTGSAVDGYAFGLQHNDLGETFLAAGSVLTDITLAFYDMSGLSVRLVVSHFPSASIPASTSNIPISGFNVYSQQFSITSNGLHTFSDLGIETQVGERYIAYVTTAGLSVDQAVNGGVGVVAENTYPDGSFYYRASGFETFHTDDVDGWTPRELLFTANFTTTDVPEPASLALLGLGAAGVLAARRRRSVA